MAAVAVAALGLAPVANADTGTGGYTILHASSGDMAHVCQVISNEATYQAVVCADLTTYESGGDYYVQAEAEAYCQTSKGAQTPCGGIGVEADLFVAGGGDDTTLPYGNSCVLNNGNGCTPNTRSIAQTRTWDYSIAAAANGVCSSNPNSSYNVWGLVLGYNNGQSQYLTDVMTPDDRIWTLGDGGIAPNDGTNESTGHYYICP